jgi:hypothetical protein
MSHLCSNIHLLIAPIKFIQLFSTITLLYFTSLPLIMLHNSILTPSVMLSAIRMLWHSCPRKPHHLHVHYYQSVMIFQQLSLSYNTSVSGDHHVTTWADRRVNTVTVLYNPLMHHVMLSIILTCSIRLMIPPQTDSSSKRRMRVRRAADHYCYPRRVSNLIAYHRRLHTSQKIIILPLSVHQTCHDMPHLAVTSAVNSDR